MPVYNEERYLPETLDSILEQDFRNFELVISDNGSNDNTRNICRQYASGDRRIRYLRSEENYGSIWNFNRVVQLSTGRYFVWASGHDIWLPGFLSRCFEILEDSPDVVICASNAAVIDSNQRILLAIDDLIDTRLLNPARRFKELVLWSFGYRTMIYGLMRTDALRATRLYRRTYGADLVLLAELSLLGPFLQFPERLFLIRASRPSEVSIAHTLERVSLQGTGSGRYDPRFTLTHMVYELLEVALKCGLSHTERMGLVLHMIQLYFGRPFDYALLDVEYLLYRFFPAFTDRMTEVVHGKFGEPRNVKLRGFYEVSRTSS